MDRGRAITSGRHLTSAVLGACILLLASAAGLVEEPRSRTLFSQGANTARDLIPVLDPAIAPPAGSEASVYLPVRFPHDSDRLSDKTRRNPSVISEMMLAPDPGGMPFTVEMHTDAGGGAAFNENLSLRWARSAADYFVRPGVPRSQLAIRSLGETVPLSGEQRRVEFARRFQGGGLA
ncbi:MAG: OmpA family protein [Rhodobacteraceae bacterium]|nr:OmpA family protein [Paracoccaceae bacterium]MCY4140668.1 OmpA family protein [Paracoccaceae bacterium]